ncbi:hypothetical protein Pelo_11820 [Pelomyxa schiedti]|nr:hypothetical protein Pelo_11820 [Pelomyxa schiedti]
MLSTYSCLIVLVVAILAPVVALDGGEGDYGREVPGEGLRYSVDSGTNPTYLQLCILNLPDGVTLNSVAIEIYDWASTPQMLVSPTRTWYQMIFGYGTCWSTSDELDIIWVPASIRVTSTSLETVQEDFIISSLVVGAVFQGKNNFAGYSDSSIPNACDPPLIDASNVTHLGGAVFFDPTDWACGYGNPLPSFWGDYYSTHYAAFRELDWDNAHYCGACLRLWNTFRSVSTEVVVLDECPTYWEGSSVPQSCSRLNWFDISPDAFEELGALKSWGEQQIQWEFTSCTHFATNTFQFALEDWSENYGFSFTVHTHVNCLDTVSIKPTTGTQWTQLSRDEYNFFSYDGVAMTCPCVLKLCSVEGECVTDTSFSDTIENLPKKPSYITGTAQFSVIPWPGDDCTAPPCGTCTSTGCGACIADDVCSTCTTGYSLADSGCTQCAPGYVSSACTRSSETTPYVTPGCQLTSVSEVGSLSTSESASESTSVHSVSTSEHFDSSTSEKGDSSSGENSLSASSRPAYVIELVLCCLVLINL